MAALLSIIVLDFAEAKTVMMKGIGVDEQACAAKVVINQGRIVSVDLMGPARQFKYNKVLGFIPVGSYKTMMMGAPMVMGPLAQFTAFPFFQYYSNLPESESFKFSTAMIPSDEVQKKLKGAEITSEMELEYTDGKLTKVTASRSTLAYGMIEVEGADFYCEVP